MTPEMIDGLGKAAKYLAERGKNLETDGKQVFYVFCTDEEGKRFEQLINNYLSYHGIEGIKLQPVEYEM